MKTEIPTEPTVNKATLAELRERLDKEIKPGALAWLRQHGWLRADQDIDALTQVHARRINTMWQQFLKVAAPARYEAEVAKEKLLEHDRHVAVRMNWFERICPEQFQYLGADTAPRPKRFSQVAEFFASPAYDELGARGGCGLILLGGSGLGKTASCWAALVTYWDRWPEREALFVKTVTFMRAAKSRHLSNDLQQEFREKFRDILRTDLLILDDLGTEKFSQSSEEVFYELIDTRTERRRFTIITTNYAAEQMNFDERNREKILRRLAQFFFVVNFDK